MNRLFSTLIVLVAFTPNHAYSRPAPPPPVFFEGVCVVCPKNPVYGTWGIEKDGKVVWGHTQEFKDAVGELTFVVINLEGKILLSDAHAQSFENEFSWPNSKRLIRDKKSKSYFAKDGKLVDADMAGEVDYAFWNEDQCWVSDRAGGFKTIAGKPEALSRLGSASSRPHYITGYAPIITGADDGRAQRRWGLYDVGNKEELVPPQFDYIDTYPGDLVAFKNQGRWSYYNIKTNQRLTQDFHWAWFFSEGKALVHPKPDTCAIIDTDGETLFELKSDWGKHHHRLEDIGTIENWRWGASRSNIGLYRSGLMFLPGLGMINSTGESVTTKSLGIQESYEIGPLVGDLISITANDGKVGYSTISGEVVVKPVWDVLGQFSEGLAYAQHDGRYAFIDNTGKVVLGPYRIGEQLRP